MCGIAGWWADPQEFPSATAAELARRMADSLAHRGPDDQGWWIDNEAGILLAHRRLAIVDLSETGRQPMRSSDGRWVLVYNGELYNHLALRKELSEVGCSFRGHSDTETLVEAIRVWGVGQAVSRANGMFAFAAWDAREQTLYLARDRLGIKPLYYGNVRGGLAFASELKALELVPGFSPTVDPAAVCLLLQHNYIGAPYSIYRGVFKLQAGHILVCRRKQQTETVRFWDLKDAVDRGSAEPFQGTEEDAVDVFGDRLKHAVQRRLLSDVPLGAFLSGGLDSTAIVAMMQRAGTDRAKTFCMGFDQPDCNEAPYARRVAEALGTEHVEYTVTSQDALDIVPRLTKIYDEPFADSSQIPTFLVCQLARRHVTVCLSGDGGDEFLGGYERYATARRWWRRLSRVPYPVRRWAANRLRRWVPARGGSTAIRRARTLGELLAAPDPRQLYTRFHTHWKEPARIVRNGRLPMTLFYACDDWPDRRDIIESWMYIDGATYLPDDILTKVDRASMAVSLEVRVPLLDHELVEFLWTLPAHFKWRQGTSKWILRQLLDRFVDRDLVERPKMGFGVPLAEWLRGPLRDWAESLLGDQQLARSGIWNPEPIGETWRRHVTGQDDGHYYLWDVLMFQAWHSERYQSV